VSNVIHLSDYRNNLRTQGTTLCWRSLRHDLAGPRCMSFCEALYEANVDGGTHAAAGFVITAGKRELVCEGWDMGPMTVRRGAEATRIGAALVDAELARVKADRGGAA
jgi:hypothetical protein